MNLIFYLFLSFGVFALCSECQINSQNFCFCSVFDYSPFFNQSLKFTFKNTECLPKYNNILNRSILILNRNCSSCKLNDFDEYYSSLLSALQMENKLVLNNLFAVLNFFLQDGNHYIFAKDLMNSGIQLFRNSLVDITIQPLEGSSNIVFKTDEIFFFISKSLIIQNITFDGIDMISQKENDPKGCYNQEGGCCTKEDLVDAKEENCFLSKLLIENSSSTTFKYGLFNIEYLLNSF